MKKITSAVLGIGLAFYFTNAASAKSVSETQAQRVAERFLTKSHARANAKNGTAHAMTLVSNNALLQTHDGLQQGADPAFYIFNATGSEGYVIVSGEDLLPEILAYSLDGSWPDDQSLIPTPLRNALLHYAAYVESVREGSSAIRQRQASSESGEGQGEPLVGPLLTTKWDQSYPYNKFAPMSLYDDERHKAFLGHCAIGCTAVAVGQVVNYWGQRTGFPAHPNAHDTFATYHKCYRADSTVVVDTAYYSLDPATHYDYQNIPDSIGYQADLVNVMSQEEWEIKGDAVGTLLHDIAYALNMEWDKLGGTAWDLASADVLYKCFGFSMKSNGHVEKEVGAMSRKENMDIIKANLDKGYPVLASGADKRAGGHCFVYDGYDSHDYIHINWGWGGHCNNWFDLSYLQTNMFDAREPANYNFNNDQGIVYDIHPVEDGEVETPEIADNLQAYYCGLDYDDSDYKMISGFFGTKVGGFEPVGYLDKYFNNTRFISSLNAYHKSFGYDYETEFCVKNTDTGTEIRTTLLNTEAKNYGLKLADMCVWMTEDFDISALEDGKYTVSAKAREMLAGETGEWQAPMYSSDPFIIKGNHIIVNQEAHEKLYHAENCCHHLVDHRNMVFAHIEYDKDPKNILPGDSLMMLFELEFQVINAKVFQAIGSPEACVVIQYSDDSQKADTLVDFMDVVKYMKTELDLYGRAIGSRSYGVNIPITEADAGKTIHLTVRLPFTADGITFTNDITVTSTTGIVDVKQQQSGDTRCYNISGQEVNSTYRGLVIRDGKKFLQMP